ncbi:beta-mannosidase [Rhodococcus spelaei]|uniref:beta-mannosidase n=1 Tax=Rhodococcus spelaei TaxID=2546320 RepID=UPI0015EFBEFF|nr:beta-mannosidase [Rhodococcus spelaei]
MMSRVAGRRGLRRILAIVSIVAALGLGGVTVAGAQSGGRVGVEGTSLRLDGKAWWPAGFNAYQLATNWSVNKGCGAEVNLDEYFAGLPPHSLTRFNAFEALATDKVTGRRDWTAVDAVFRAAERHGQLLVPVLTAQDGACENEVFKQRDWYADGWRSAPHGAAASFAEWTESAVTRWRDSPALAAWELVGEPETSVCHGGNCDLASRTCPPDAASVLRSFMDEAGAVVRRAAPGSLITAGLTGGGQCGTAGDDYQYVGASPNVDILQYHDYHADGIALPGDRWNGLAVRIRQANEIGKPLLVAEIGQAAGPGAATVERRAFDIERKISGQRAAGTAGALLWSFVPDPRHQDATYDIGKGDPLFAVMAHYNAVGGPPGRD